MTAAIRSEDETAGSGEPCAEPGGWLVEPAGLVRERLIRGLVTPSSFAVARVVAPAGSGKSRLLLHAARHYPGLVAWCGTPDPVPRTEAALVTWIADALESTKAMEWNKPETVEGLVRSGPPKTGVPALVVMDDAHLMESSDAEAALSDLVSRIPAWMRILIAGRASLAIDVSRLRVSGRLVEVRQDDLRFRTWEIEELFRDVYGDPLVPEDVGALARRTGGWAAYLQLFHLATSQKPQRVRRQVLDTLAGQPRLVTEYLSRHVLAGLSAELQDFLVRTSVLRRPTVGLCDELLDRRGSEGQLRELERRQLFTERLTDLSYRYHPVLLAYLDSLLVQTLGLEAARAEHRKAARMLEREGFTEDALAAYAKSEDWTGVARVLGHTDSSPGLGDAWLEALPPTVIATDSLLLVARARRALASGALEEAIQILRDAQAAAVSSAISERCLGQRELLGEWANPDRVQVAVTSGWTTLLRAATQRQPAAVQARAASLPGAEGRLVEGLAAFFYGDLKTAVRALRSAANNPDSHPWMSAAGWLGIFVATSMAGEPLDPSVVGRVREEVDLAAVPWLTRVARVALVSFDPAFDSSPHERRGHEFVLEFVEACEREGDRWGAALVSMLHGLGGVLAGGNDVYTLERAARLLKDLGAGVLSARAAAFLAIAAHNAGRSELARRAASEARALGTSLDLPVASGLAALVSGLEKGDPGEVSHARDLLDSIGWWETASALLGLGKPVRAGSPERGVGTPSAKSASSSVTLRCLGSFVLEVDGRAFEESAAKPMERSLLHLLGARAGERVHREQIIEALWPEADPDAGRHRLQVAVSSLRRLFAGLGAGARLVVRDGDAYRLALPPDADVDIWRVEQSLRRAADARSVGDFDSESAALFGALTAYGGTLLPMDGLAEWAAGPRRYLQVSVADAATRLAGLLIDSSDFDAAKEAARRGIAIDRYRDDLWRLCIEVAERSGNHADAQRVRQDYAGVLEELGI